MSANPYESSELLAQYLLFHYGSAKERVGWSSIPEPEASFPARTVRELVDLDALPEDARALDLGCAVGRSALELSRHCAEVWASDLSQSFIDAARAIAGGESIDYEFTREGHLMESHSARAPEDCHPQRVQFEQADACDLPAELQGFDLVHAANLICRLPQPRTFLQRLPDLVKPGGQLLLATPCTWLGEFTPPEHWPIGSTLEWLETELAGAFELQHRCDLPMIIRETHRKFQMTMSEGTRWVRV